jgi:hypothetical protein
MSAHTYDSTKPREENDWKCFYPNVLDIDASLETIFVPPECAQHCEEAWRNDWEVRIIKAKSRIPWKSGIKNDVRKSELKSTRITANGQRVEYAPLCFPSYRRFRTVEANDGSKY